MHIGPSNIPEGLASFNKYLGATVCHCLFALKARADNPSYLKVPVNGGFTVKNNPLWGGEHLSVFSLPGTATIDKAGE